MKYAYESWRREWGSRKCGGVLVWQLNDCWPTMSWAVVDYHRVKKPAYYAISRAMKPVAVGISRAYHSWTAGHDDPRVAAKDTKFDIWVASSLTTSVDVEMIVRFISIRSGNELTDSIKKQVSVGANGTTEVLQGCTGPETCPNIDETAPFSIESYEPYVVHATVTLGNETLASDIS
jgi:beta-mannosidase